jgi:hypothetical protein
VRQGFERTRSVFEEAGARARAESPDPNHVLRAMGDAYRRHLGDRGLLRLQLQAYAACDDPEIRATVADEFRAVYRSVARVSGADQSALEAWFATGMLLNVLAAIGELRAAEAPLLAGLAESDVT